MLHLTDLHKSFYDPGRGEVRAVDGIELHLPAGVVAVMGANGAGKTTLLRLIAGLLEPDRGSVRLADCDAQRDGEAYRRNLGYLATSTRLPPLLTPRELFAFLGDLHNIGAAELAERIVLQSAQFGIADLLDQRLSTLSTGQAQRVNLARTLLADPPLLILDEPTTGLDVLAAAQVVHAIQQVRQQGRLILYCTHVPAEAEAVADDLVLIRQGQVAFHGPPAELGTGAGLAHAVRQALEGAVAPC